MEGWLGSRRYVGSKELMGGGWDWEVRGWELRGGMGGVDGEVGGVEEMGSGSVMGRDGMGGELE